MTKHNLRKEPTFGSPSAQTEIDFSESSEQITLPKVSISAQSDHKPSYTFTPVMTRPAELAKDFSTFEEKNALQRTQETAEQETVKPISGLKFAPVEEATEVIELNAPPQPQIKPQQVEESPLIVTATTAAPVMQEVEKPEPVAESVVERVIPAAVAAGVAKASLAEKVPSKYRRILVVALIGLALLLIIWLLKPSTPETVEQLQQQGNSLPIEFRPVNEEEAKRAEAEAKALQEAQAKAAAEAQLLAQQQAAQSEVKPQVQQPIQSEPVITQPVAQPQPQQPQVSQPENVVAVPKPNSVIHQSEEPEPKPVAKPVEKVEKKVEKPQSTPTKTQAKELDNLVKVVDAKPALPAATSTSGAVKTKVLTVNKGVTLMQTFRDNQLNIADVNAMSKVNNVVSNLKVGEKVTVKLDKNNRVVEMSLSSGGKFVRQANGSYTFK